MKIIPFGDLFDYMLETDAVMHQVNCRGVMGGGIAALIKSKYFTHFEDYINHINSLVENGKHPLGTFVISSFPGQSDIVGVFGQDSYSHDGIATVYDALEKSIKDAVVENKYKKIAVPYNIGCDLAGGDWAVVSEILERIETETKVKIIVCDIHNVSGEE